MTMAQIKEIDTIKKVGVFVNATIEEVLHTVEECGLSMVQLHGDESPTFCATISKEVPVVKAFRVGDNDVLEEMVKPYEDVCSMFLFDTMGPGYGGTGKKFEWNILQQSKINKPYFLSGGIGLDDLQNLSLFAKDPVASALFAIDINSKFELQPGVKDLDKVATFINNSKSIL
jgi:phosphoribosylanthranilate isomerase